MEQFKDIVKKLYQVDLEGFQRKKTENFKTKSEEEKLSELIYNILYFVVVAPWFIAMLVIWIRLVVIAFRCSTTEGLCSLFFYPIYKIWKLGSLIQLYCEKRTTSLF